MKLVIICTITFLLGIFCSKAFGAGETTTYVVTQPDGTKQVCTVFSSGAVVCR